MLLDAGSVHTRVQTHANTHADTHTHTAREREREEPAIDFVLAAVDIWLTAVEESRKGKGGGGEEEAEATRETLISTFLHYTLHYLHNIITWQTSDNISYGSLLFLVSLCSCYNTHVFKVVG